MMRRINNLLLALLRSTSYLSVEHPNALTNALARLAAWAYYHFPY